MLNMCVLNSLGMHVGLYAVYIYLCLHVLMQPVFFLSLLYADIYASVCEAVIECEEVEGKQERKRKRRGGDGMHLAVPEVKAQGEIEA